MPKPIWPLQWQLGKEVEHNAFVKFLLKSFSLILEHNLENEAVLISKGSFVYLLSYAYAFNRFQKFSF